MTGQHNGNPYAYIKQITYDLFEQRTAIKYGNNTVNTYAYDSKLRRLKSMTAKQSNNTLLLDNTYSYDLVGNIVNLTNGNVSKLVMMLFAKRNKLIINTV